MVNIHAVKKKATEGDAESQFQVYCALLGGSKPSRSQVKEALYWLRKAANQHHAQAAEILSARYIRGIQVPQSNTLGLRYMQVAADAGHAEAATDLGSSLTSGRHGVVDIDKGVAYLQRAAQLGDIRAGHILNDMAKTMPGMTPRDPRQYAIELAGAVARGDSKAMMMLAECYRYGDGVTQDYDRAFKLYDKSVAMGNKFAITDLAQCYIHGQGVQQDYAHAVQLLQQCMDCDYGADACYLLSKCYDKGLGVPCDEYKAVQLLEKGMAIKSQPHFNKLRCLLPLAYRYSTGTGVDQNYNRAIELFEQAVDYGDKECRILLADCYLRRKNKNYTRAAQLLQQCHDDGDTDAAATLGSLLLQGRGVPRDQVKAFQLFQIAADAGVSEAQFNLAYCYNKGCGVQRDEDKALQLYIQAAQSGYVKANHAVALMYMDKNNKNYNMTLGIQHMTLSADAGDATSQLRLGMCYLNGEGVPIDQDKARHYFKLCGKDMKQFTAKPAEVAKPMSYCTECPICMEDLEQNNTVPLPCKHALCHGCAVSYFSSHYLKQTYAAITSRAIPTCPCCRADIPDEIVKQCTANSNRM